MRNILIIACWLLFGSVYADEVIVHGRPLPRHAPRPVVTKFVVPAHVRTVVITPPVKIVAPVRPSRYYWRYGTWWKTDTRWWLYDPYWDVTTFSNLYAADPNFYFDAGTGIWFRYYRNVWFAYHENCWYSYHKTNGWQFAFRVR